VSTRERFAAQVLEADLLGSARGAPRVIRGPRASRLYMERFAPSGEVGEGPALVFTHGWCVTEAIWHYQKTAQPLGDFAKITWDLPGHGHSTPVTRSHLTLDLAVDSLARVVDAADGSVLLIGHSLGGVLSLGYLVRHRETAKRRVRGLVLVATPLVHMARRVTGRWPGSSLGARALGLGMQLMVENSLVDRWFAAQVGNPSVRGMSYRVMRMGFGSRPRPDHVRFVRDMAATVPAGVRADTFRAMTGFDLRPVLPQVRAPTLVVVGAKDLLVSRAESRTLSSLLPRGRPVEFADAGHAPFLERHEEFNEVLARFAVRRFGPGSRAPEPVNGAGVSPPFR
jgi:pimeloyl-ACP methyl ester carboxylesterase